MTPETIALLRMLRLDGLATTTAQEIVASLDDALKTIAEQLVKIEGSEETFVYARLVSMRSQILDVSFALNASIAESLYAALDGVVKTAPAVVAQQMRVAVPAIHAGFAMVPFEAVAAVKDIPYDGFSWTRWGERLADGTLKRVEHELRQSVALGESTRDAAKRIDRVAKLGRVSATRLARTAITATDNRAQMAQWREPSVREYADGWRYTSVLDTRVSLVCAALHGRIFGLDDLEAPFPPRHPNCRSSMALVFKEGKFTRAFYEKRGSGEDWLRGLPEAEQREILGSGRFEMFQRGVNLPSMVTYDAPLSVADLTRLYPEPAQ